MADLSSLLGVPTSREQSDASHEINADDGSWAMRLRIGEVYNEHMPSTWDASYLQRMTSALSPRISLAVSTDLKQWNYRYMYEKKGERSLELDTRLGDMGDEIQHAFGLTTEWDDPTIPNQESIYTVGRVCARIDPSAKDESTHTKLTPSNLVLETSRMVGNGQRIPLMIDPKCVVKRVWTAENDTATSVMGLFPGMIVGVKGRNGSGHCFVAEQFLMVRREPLHLHSRRRCPSQQH